TSTPTGPRRATPTGSSGSSWPARPSRRLGRSSSSTDGGQATMATLTTSSPRAATRRESSERAPRTVSPRVDIYETDKAYVRVVDLPGAAADGVDAEAGRGPLVIRGRVERPATPPDYQEFELADY